MAGPNLRRMAADMLREAEIADCAGAYAATGHSTDNISILHQQMRCMNLVWALIKMRKIKHGSVVGIVGGSFSGLMLAACLALQKRCIVYIYEKEERLLDRFRDAPFRFIHPNLNSRDLPPRYVPEMARAVYTPPIFNWPGGTASEIAHFWLREFQTYYSRLPIFLRRRTEIIGCHRDQSSGAVLLEAAGKGGQAWHDAVDIAIFATGFGVEQNRLNTLDWSYWKSGSVLQYRPGRRSPDKERVLISGCGDSGVVELMHYIFRDFEHRQISDFYPAGSGIESYVQPMLQQSQFWQIRYSQELDQFDREVISELCWFYQEKWFRDNNPGPMRQFRKDMDSDHIPLADAVDVLFKDMSAHLQALGVDVGVSLDWAQNDDRFRQQIAGLNDDTQFAFRAQFRQAVANVASIELKQKIGAIDIAAFGPIDWYKDRLLNRFEIWLNDSTPTPYTDKISPANLIYLRLCEALASVRFVAGRVAEINEIADGYEVVLGDGQRLNFDRVATRFGLGQTAVNTAMLRSIRRKKHFGDWLLEAPDRIVSTTVHNQHSSTTHHENPAEEGLVRAVKEFEERRFPLRDKAAAISKLLYLAGLHAGDHFPADSFYAHPEAPLRLRLKKGMPVTFIPPDGEVF